MSVGNRVFSDQSDDEFGAWASVTAPVAMALDRAAGRRQLPDWSLQGIAELSYIDDLIDHGTNFQVRPGEGTASFTPVSGRDEDIEAFQGVGSEMLLDPYWRESQGLKTSLTSLWFASKASEMTGRRCLAVMEEQRIVERAAHKC